MTAEVRAIAPKWSHIYCDCCGDVRPLVVDELLANENNDHDGLDLICAECHFVIATLHAARALLAEKGEGE